MEEYRRLLNDKTKFVSITHVSNALGTIVPVKEIVALAHERGVPVMLDGAQAVPHLKVDVQDLGCDFYAFSGHKLFGPTGVGVLYGRAELLEKMPPYQGGGDMISLVTFEKTHYNVLPYKFEAGTPHIAGGIGLGAAIDYLLTLELAAGRGARARAAELRDGCAVKHRRLCASLAPLKRKPACYRLSWITCTPTMSARFSTKKEWRCAPGIIARCR